MGVGMNHVADAVDYLTPRTSWEKNVTATRWGKYITAVEQRLILQGQELAGLPTKALEIGIGGGRWGKMLNDLGWQITGTDIDPESLNICRERIPDAECICVEPDSREFPSQTGSMRLLLGIEVSEMLECDWFTEEAQRVLEPGGVFVGVFQNRRSLRGQLKNWFPTKGDENARAHYKVAYSPWRKKMIKHDFKMIEEVGLCWLPLFSRDSDSCMIPAAVAFEKWAGLRTMASLSPWIVFIAQKVEGSEHQ